MEKLPVIGFAPKQLKEMPLKLEWSRSLIDIVALVLLRSAKFATTKKHRPSYLHDAIPMSCKGHLAGFTESNFWCKE